MKKLPASKRFSALARSAIAPSRGFTLIELLVVVSIIAVLAIVGVVIFSGAQKNSRDSRRRADIQAISQALEVHINKSTNENCTGAAGTYCAPVATWFAGNAIPTDPGTSSAYTGLPANGATSYTVCATLESGGTFCQSNQQ